MNRDLTNVPNTMITSYLMRFLMDSQDQLLYLNEEELCAAARGFHEDEINKAGEDPRFPPYRGNTATRAFHSIY